MRDVLPLKEACSRRWMEGTFASLLPADMLSQALCFPSPATEHRPWLAGQPQPRTAKARLKGVAAHLPVFRAAFTDIRGRLSTLRVKGRIRDSHQHALSSEISLTHVSVLACLHVRACAFAGSGE